MLKQIKYYYRILRRMIRSRHVLISQFEKILNSDLHQRRFAKLFGYWPEGLEYDDINILKLSPYSRIGKMNRLLFNKTKYPCSEMESQISLGKGCSTGVNVELNILPGTQIIFKDYARVQDYCKIIGDVTIEKYSGVAYGTFISSSRHYLLWRNPDIRMNQDQYHLNDPDLIRSHSKPVHIEEDCLIGISCFINAGIYLGRGARIGANTVVLKDVMPYSVVIGVPGRQYLNNRFDFLPPPKIEAAIVDNKPYFYRGFLHLNDEGEEVLDKNLIAMGENACIIVLKKGEINNISLTGKIFFNENQKLVNIELIYNGKQKFICELMIAQNGSFAITVNMQQFFKMEKNNDDPVFRLAKFYNVFHFSYKFKSVFVKAPIVAINYIEETLLT